MNGVIFIPTFVVGNLVFFLLGLQPGDFPERAWTMVTSLFVHGGIGHILANMITLYFFGRYLITLVGEKKFLTVYFIGGILGNILLLLLAPIFPFSVAIGASGAVFAVGGALAVMRPKTRVFVFPIPAPLPLWVAVIGGFVIISFLPNIAWQAHLGGLLLGLTMGYFFRKRERLFF
ncbi:rhomboid family intramembrane serine protease [Chloroflexota bacterium]